MVGEVIRIRGTVQGVGFRPTVARIARELGLPGWVRNDAEGVLIALGGAPDDRDAFLQALLDGLPPLASVDSVAREPTTEDFNGGGFRITKSERSAPRTAVTPDAATCPACLAEVTDPAERRYRYPFASCTHCGPRFSVVTDIPWDRPNTTLVGFPLCPDCDAEYTDETDRRYHAQPLACPTCGPRAWLERADGLPFELADLSAIDAVDAATKLLKAGDIVALKGLGGYQLLCDATNEEAVDRLRARKHRPVKPFALMCRDLEVLRRFAIVSVDAVRTLTSPAAPIALLPAVSAKCVASGVAPGQRRLGVMLPTTPLHHLLLQHVDHPVVCTSGNVVDEPQCTDDDDARARLADIADWLLVNDRPIAHRVDDSVVHRVDGGPQIIRRARGYAPAPLPLPPGLEGGPSVLAMGAHLKATLGFSRDSEVVLSQHLGDLDDIRAFGAWQSALKSLTKLYEHEAEAIAVDLHPEYRSTQVGLQIAKRADVPVIEVQHHHAHIAACMAEHGVPADAPPVLGLALDGLGLGDTLWGGEALLCTYADFTRVGGMQPVPLLGGDRAAREPWRNLYAHLRELYEWDEVDARWHDVPAIRRLWAWRTPLFRSALATEKLSPRCSSAGRLFDAVAAALDIYPNRVDDEGQAAIALEAKVDPMSLHRAAKEPLAYVIRPTPSETGPCTLHWDTLWPALLDDLRTGVDHALIAARFHVGLASALVALAECARPDGDEPVAALSGGCWQNVLLTELVADRLRNHGWRVLVHRRVPPNDGGIAYGQAVVAAARLKRDGV